ncbi:MAG: MATE family efflux transporter [Flavobacteriales bacterium]|nr:MATE family efflux transporter [Flavobacteriales bacterium]
MSARSTITRKDIDRLAVPAIISGIAEPVISLIDTAFIGRLHDIDMLGAVGIGSSFFLLVLWVLAQTRSAVLAVVARYYGEQRIAGIAGLVPMAMWTNFALGLLFLAITYPFAEQIFQAYNAGGRQLELTCDYFRIRSLGFPISLAVYALTGAFRGLQNLRWSMWISLIGAGVNLVLNPLLIFGYGPFPAMGIEGSALSSVIAQTVMLATCVFILRTRTPFALWPPSWRHPEFAPLMRNSGQLFARTIALNVCYYLGNRYATGYGAAYIAAHSIAMQIWLFSAFFIDGYAAAGSVLTGRLNGERNWRELYSVSWQVVRMSVTIGAILAVIYLIGYKHIGGFFTDDAVVLALLDGVFWMVVLTQPINAIAFAFDGIYKGMGNGKILRNVLLISTFLVFVPVVWGMDAFGWKLHAVWAAFLAWMLVRGALLAMHFEKHHRPHAA